MKTRRLQLVPLTIENGRAVLAGDLSGLETAAGWPHDDTLDAIRTAVGTGPRSLVWLVTLDGVVIGDCGTVGPLRAGGEIEIGYGLAAEHRGRGYGTEVVAAPAAGGSAQPYAETRSSGFTISAKWQAEGCPCPRSFKTGSSSAQIGCAFQQRVRKRQPDGGFAGLGTSPSSTIRLRLPRCDGSSIGTAESSACVYGCAGES
jgi:hypothetical protein